MSTGNGLGTGGGNGLNGPPPPEPVRKVRADALERASTAWSVRVAGGTWAQAAEAAGFHDSDAATKAVRRHYGTLPVLARDDLRGLWRDRLELAWRQVCRDMTEQKPGAVTAAVRVAGMALTLDGLAEPVRVDMTVSDTFEALTRELLAHDL
jgi:AraC-like DNA-binding protein